MFASRCFFLKIAFRLDTTFLFSEPVFALLGPLLFAVNTVNGLCIFVFYVNLASGILNGHIVSDHFDEAKSLLIGYFGVFSCHLIILSLDLLNCYI